VTVWLFADIFNWGKTPTSEWGNTNFTDVKPRIIVLSFPDCCEISKNVYDSFSTIKLIIFNGTQFMSSKCLVLTNAGSKVIKIEVI